MKIIKITESQYKRLVSKKLNESIIYNDSEDKSDVTILIRDFLKLLSDTLLINYKQDVYVDKIVDGVVYIDGTKYNEEEKNLIEYFIDWWVDNGNVSTPHKKIDGLTYDSGKDWDYDENIVNDTKCWCNDKQTDEEIEYLCIDGLPNNCVKVDDVADVDGEEENTEESSDCNLSNEEMSLFNEKIYNFKTANNFRWWIHQKSKRLRKVEKKLKSCGLKPEFSIVCKWTVGIDNPIGSTFFENQYMNRYGNYLKTAFKLFGKDWIDAGNGGVRPKSTYEGSNGNLSSNDLVVIQSDVNNNTERLHKDAVDSWNKMVASAAADGTDITISDAYRPCGEPGDYERYLNKEVRFTQWAAWRKWDNKSGSAAKPYPDTEEKWIKNGGGYCISHHGFKGAVDISDGKSWMKKNAPKFGWCKYIKESWHWDYYGDDIENHLSEDGINCK